MILTKECRRIAVLSAFRNGFMVWKHDAVDVRRYGAQDLANIHRRAVGWKQRLVRVDGFQEGGLCFLFYSNPQFS